MSTSPSPTTLTALFCVKCGYDLRGQGPDATCPECGLPVSRSATRHTELWYSDMRWLKRVRLGIIVLLVGVVVNSGYTIAVGLWTMFRDADFAPFVGVVGGAVFLGTMVGNLLGVILVTRRDKAWAARRPRAAVRIRRVQVVTLIAAVLYVALQLGLATLAYLLRDADWISFSLMWLSWIGTFVFQATTTIGLLLLYVHFASRSRAPRLAALVLLWIVVEALSILWHIVLIILSFWSYYIAIPFAAAGGWLMRAVEIAILIAVLLKLQQAVVRARQIETG